MQHLQGTTKRVVCMPSFHDRPREMDSRVNAVSTIRISQDSTHIFGEENELDTHKEGMSNAATNIRTAKSCPFTSCGLHPRLVRAFTGLNGINIKNPTVIQHNTWKCLLLNPSKKSKMSNFNLIVQSETGSGKTLAYLLPLLQFLAINVLTNEVKRIDRHIGGTRAIVLCPTRELAMQTYCVAESVCRASFPWIVPGCLSGGEKRKSEKAKLRKGLTIIFATPGRLLDHLDNTECLLLSLKGKLEWIVLDESDRLLDMGLSGQVERIVQTVRTNQSGSGPRRDGVTWRSILVSATITDYVEDLAKLLLGGMGRWVWARAMMGMDNDNRNRNYDGKKNDDVLLNQNEMHTNKKNDNETTSISNQNFQLSSATPRQLTQLYMIVSAKIRLSALVAFLTMRVRKKERMVIFMSTCDGVHFHHKLFTSMTSILQSEECNKVVDEGLFGSNCSIYRLHGNVPHNERYAILANFTKLTDERKASILIATDVAARGLNLPSVDWIVQYDPPCDTNDYVHRAGRAARAGKGGHTLLFLLPSERQYVDVLRFRGLNDIMALSLFSTLESAAKLCPHITASGRYKDGIGRDRDGEAFASAIHARLAKCITDHDEAYNESLMTKVALRGNKKKSQNAQVPFFHIARKAFSAYVRAYPTKEKSVKHIFSTRSLHLGHVARSFALKEAPRVLAKVASRSRPGRPVEDNNGMLTLKGKKRNFQLAFGNNENTDSSIGEWGVEENGESVKGITVQKEKFRIDKCLQQK